MLLRNLLLVVIVAIVSCTHCLSRDGIDWCKDLHVALDSLNITELDTNLKSKIVTGQSKNEWSVARVRVSGTEFARRWPFSDVDNDAWTYNETGYAVEGADSLKLYVGLLSTGAGGFDERYILTLLRGQRLLCSVLVAAYWGDNDSEFYYWHVVNGDYFKVYATATRQSEIDPLSVFDIPLCEKPYDAE